MQQSPTSPTTAVASLAFAKKAALEGDAEGMLRHIHETSFLAGLVRRLERTFDPHLPSDEANAVVAEALGVVYADVRAGKLLDDLAPCLFKVARNMASKKAQAYRVTEALAYDTQDHRPQTPVGEAEESELRLQRAVQAARQLLPRLGHANVQAVVRYIIDAVATGVFHVSDAEIAAALGLKKNTATQCRIRGLERLCAHGRKAGLLDNDFDLSTLGLSKDDSPPSKRSGTKGRKGRK